MEQLKTIQARWVIILPKKEAGTFPTDEFEIVHEIENFYSKEYETILIELNKKYLEEYDTSGITPEDVLAETGAIACHEEWTNGFVTTIEDVEQVNDLYGWNGGGETLFSELLTDTEKLSALLNHLYELDPQKQIKSVNDIFIQLEKDGEWFPLADNIEMLFTKDIHHFKYKEEDYSCWWPSIIPTDEFFLVLLDDTLDDEDEKDEKTQGPFNLLPPDKRKDWYWDDDYDYDDYKYYQHLY